MYTGGNYVQYDTVAYPCEEVVSATTTKASKRGSTGAADRRAWLSYATGVMKATIGRVWSYAAGTTEGSFAMSHKDERVYSLCIYLKPYADALCCGTYTKTLVKMAEEMVHIYNLMSNVQIFNDNGCTKKPVNVSQVTVEFYPIVM